MALNKNKSLYKSCLIRKERELKPLLKNKGLNYIDAFSYQLKELFFIEKNQFIGQKKDFVYKTKEFKEYIKDRKDNFVHIYFPWNNTLVKTVPGDAYIELKTNRNRDLITKEEQAILLKTKVGVFGMSVGSNIAFVLTQAGISNEITIADFDLLDTTNLNRILAGIHQVGLPKVVVASRRIYEDNPFAKVTLMPKGVSEKNLEDLLKKGKLDLIIEEIDEMKMKIRTRILAMKYKIPVVMITDNGDGVVLHIERYDLGYKKIFNKEVFYWDELFKKEITKEIAGKMIMEDIVGGVDKVDPKMLKSVKRVLAKELVSWSQLGSAAILGGVVATVAIKKIILKEDLRPYVVEHIFV